MVNSKFSKNAVALALGLLSMVAMAADKAPVSIVKGPAGVELTTADIEADALRIPESMRGPFLAKPNSVDQMARALYVRRVMAEKARAEGMDKDPRIAAAMRIAMDKALSDAYLAKFNAKHKPSEQQLESQMQATYKVKSDGMMVPAQVHVAHILVSGVDAKAEEKATALLKQLKGGADFATLAKEKSEDTGSAAKGGDLGQLQKGRTVPEFENAAFALQKPGELSPLVKSQFGYHIIKLVDKKPEHKMSYEEARPQLATQLTDQMLQQAREQEVNATLEQAKFDQAAIEAFSKSHEDKK
ncbi:hypothetical protein GCM10027082_02530 [Comamonas humi]